MDRAIVYCRISADRTGEGAGVERQRQDAEKLAKARGWSIVSVLTDNDVSAFSGKTRPAWTQLLQELRSGSANHVVAWAGDRLYRRTRDQLDLMEAVQESGGLIATVKDGDTNPATAEGRMRMTILSSVAEFESSRKGERSARKHEELARQGRVSGGGSRPFGFEDDRKKHNKAEAAEIRKLAKRALAGESLRGLVADLARRNVPTVGGGSWTVTSLRRVLTSARIAGLRSYRGEVIVKAEWRGIIDIETHERLRTLLLDPRRRKYQPGPARRYLLTGGLASCGLCGAKLIARPKSDRRKAYVCATDHGGCGKIRSLAEPLDDLVVEAVMAAVDGPAFAAAVASTEDQDDTEVHESLADIEGRLNEAAQLFAESAISRSEWLVIRDGLERRRTEALAQLGDPRSRLLADLPGGAALRGAWDVGDLAWRRAVLFAVLERVIVNPAVRGMNTFQPERVHLAWRA